MHTAHAWTCTWWMHTHAHDTSMYMHVHMHVHACTWHMHVHAHGTCMYMHKTHACTYMRTCTYMHTHMHVHAHSAWTHRYTHACTHSACMYMHTAHAYTCTHTRTHMHIPMHVLSFFFPITWCSSCCLLRVRGMSVETWRLNCQVEDPREIFRSTSPTGHAHVHVSPWELGWTSTMVTKWNTFVHKFDLISFLNV